MEEDQESQYLLNIEDFKVLNDINKGPYWSVYRVQNSTTKDYFAAKVLNIGENQNLKMINREIELMMYMQHPTIIKLYGFSLLDFHGDENVTIFMDLAKSGSLADILAKVKNGTAPDNYNDTTKQIILVGIAKGMMLLHQNNIIHRELKPSNVLLDENLNPHITDFTISKFYESDKQMQSKTAEIPYHMAPESFDGRYNIKSDVYSFGILMYEVVTDLDPYPEVASGKIKEKTFTKKIQAELYRPQFTVPVKKPIKKLIERCWDPDPNDRPTFLEIYKKLAFNIDLYIDYYEEEDEVDDFTHDRKYFLDGVDIDDLNLYIDSINGIDESVNAKDKIENIKKQFLPIKQINTQLKTENQAIKTQVNQLMDKVFDSPSTDEDLNMKINKLFDEKLEIFQKENDEIKSKLLEVDEMIEKKLEPYFKENLDLKLVIQEMNNRVQQLEELLNEKSDEIKDLQSLNVDNEQNKIDINSIKEEVENLKTIMNEDIDNLKTIMNEEVENLKTIMNEEIDNLKTKSDDTEKVKSEDTEKAKSEDTEKAKSEDAEKVPSDLVDRLSAVEDKVNNNEEEMNTLKEKIESIGTVSNPDEIADRLLAIENELNSIKSDAKIVRDSPTADESPVIDEPLNKGNFDSLKNNIDIIRDELDNLKESKTAFPDDTDVLRKDIKCIKYELKKLKFAENTSQPDTNKPDTDKPDTNKPDTDKPDNNDDLVQMRNDMNIINDEIQSLKVQSENEAAKQAKKISTKLIDDIKCLKFEVKKLKALVIK